MEGPVDLDFLKDRIAQAADVPGNDIKPEIDRISLEWGGISQPMRLVFNGLRFINGENQVIATVPTASLTFDARSVLQGMFLPTSITIEAADHRSRHHPRRRHAAPRLRQLRRELAGRGR